MVAGRLILDALVGAAAKRMTGGAASGAGQNPLVSVLDGLLGAAGRGGAADPYVQKLREFASRNPGLTEAALTGVAGVLMRSGRTAGIAGAAARLGGLALVGALAYKAYQAYRGGQAALPSGFQPATDDDALLFARAMVAAATADGRLDDNERSRIVQAMSQAGIDAQATRWLEDELASPAGVEDLAEPVQTPEKAAQVYAAARLAIDPDTIQEREFLRQLAESLDLDQDLTRQIDEAAASVRA